MSHPLETILHSGSTHPFYVSQQISSSSQDISLESFSILTKQHLYKTLNELEQNDSSYFKGVYLSPSGGSMSEPIYFATPTKENKTQRKLFAKILKKLNVLNEDTIALVLGSSGHFMYRSLEIFQEYVERCGGTSLSLGASCPDNIALEFALKYKANTIIASPARLVQFATFVSKQKIKFTIPNVLYSNEEMHKSKFEYLKNILGCEKFSSLYGSAEGGVWGAQPYFLPLNNFLYDPSMMLLEVINQDEEGYGNVILTNLCRKKNPLIRYNSGDVGKIQKSDVLLDNGTNFMQLKFKGRKFDSFTVNGNYIDLEELSQLFSSVLEYQIILRTNPESKIDEIEFLLLDGNDENHQEFLDNLQAPLQAILGHPPIVRIVKIEEFEISPTSRKIKKIIDYR